MFWKSKKKKKPANHQKYVITGVPLWTFWGRQWTFLSKYTNVDNESHIHMIKLTPLGANSLLMFDPTPL